MQIKREQNLKIKPWKFAGIMLSYWCPAKCEFCYECCGPEYSFWVTVEDVITWWEELDRLIKKEVGADKICKIHITGGEPFGNYPLLKEILQLAKARGLPDVDKIETNAFWATDEKNVKERLEELKSLGVKLITTDADIFHQEWVPIENVRLLYRVAKEVLGPDGIRVRWQDFLENYEHLLEENSPQQLKIKALLSGRERLTGRAAILASITLEGKLPSYSFSENCLRNILQSRHIHIDPYGNIFAGTCAGLIIGNAKDGIERIYFDLKSGRIKNPIINMLVNEGISALLAFAKRCGFKELERGYINKCQLCYHVRTFLYKRREEFRIYLGPSECYPD